MGRKPKSIWDTVDFSLPTKDIAAQLGVTPTAVNSQRRKREGKPSRSYPNPKKVQRGGMERVTVTGPFILLF